MKIKNQYKGVSTFISHSSPFSDKSLPKIQCSQPPQDDNVNFKDKFAYFYPTKFALM